MEHAKKGSVNQQRDRGRETGDGSPSPPEEGDGEPSPVSLLPRKRWRTVPCLFLKEGEEGDEEPSPLGGCMGKRLCYCKTCSSFFIIAPDKACPKCRGGLVSSVVTEEEWNRSNAEQKAAYKNSLAALSRSEGAGQKKEASREEGSGDSAKAAKPFREEKSRNQSGQSKGKSLLGTLLLMLVVGFAVFMAFRPHDGACEDYESAGKKVYKQISKRDSEVYVSYNSDHFNRIIGINDDINNIMKEACKNNGNPGEGDHLAMNANWVEGEYTAVEQRDGTHNLNIRLKMSYETTGEQEEALKDQADKILAGLGLDGASDYEKVRAIYNYICSNVVYDYDHLEDDNYRLKYTAYAAALNKKAVCSGVADLFYYLATSAGLETRITVNDVHAWNIVRVDGQYYYLDPTWDLEMDESDYRYFLRGAEDFVSIMNGPEYAAHRPSMMADFLLGPKHPLANVEKDYVISEKAYVK